MPTYTVYRLTLKTPLHLGRATGPAQQRSLGLEKTEIYIPADAIFSAICQTWANFYDTESLTDFLSPYTQHADALPLTLTSAFPFAGDVYLFPKPRNFTDRSKESKRVAFVSHDIFQAILSEKPPTFDKDDLINAEKVWISPKEKASLKTSKGENLSLWKTQTTPRVTIDRQSAASEIWHVETVEYHKHCGLWFAAEFDSDETQHKFETLLRVIGDSGIGGERNAGYGTFGFTNTHKIELPTAEVGAPFLTLSRVCPKSAAELQGLLTGNVAYTLHRLTGWVSTRGSATPRKEVMVFEEGSVLNTSQAQVGRLVDLRPNDWEHPVYRYGFAWQVGIKGATA